MPIPVIELKDVNVVRDGRAVLHDLSLRVDEGEQIALLGPNGCGKSTLIKTLTCEIYPLAQPGSSVRLFGRERWDLTELKRRLGVVESDLPGRSLLECTGRETVLTGFFSSAALWPHLAVTAAMQTRADEILEQIGASALADRRFAAMSAGQQRRLLIGRALAGSADCLLLDEPSNALDLAAQHGLRELLVSLAACGTTLILITHHIADIIPAMQRVVFMNAGRIVADGSRELLLTAPALTGLFKTPVSLTERDGFLHAW